MAFGQYRSSHDSGYVDITTIFTHAEEDDKELKTNKIIVGLTKEEVVFGFC